MPPSSDSPSKSNDRSPYAREPYDRTDTVVERRSFVYDLNEIADENWHSAAVLAKELPDAMLMREIKLARRGSSFHRILGTLSPTEHTNRQEVASA
jgi:hypothetical protein